MSNARQTVSLDCLLFTHYFWHHLIAYLIQPLVNESVLIFFLIEQAETVPVPYGRLRTERGLVLIFLPFIAIIYCSLFGEVTFLLSLLYYALTHRQLVCQLQSLIKEGFLLKQTGSFQVRFVFSGKKMNYNQPKVMFIVMIGTTVDYCQCK